eukprot:420648-Amphidinium_carterae.1
MLGAAVALSLYSWVLHCVAYLGRSLAFLQVPFLGFQFKPVQLKWLRTLQPSQQPDAEIMRHSLASCLMMLRMRRQEGSEFSPTTSPDTLHGIAA